MAPSGRLPGASLPLRLQNAAFRKGPLLSAKQTHPETQASLTPLTQAILNTWDFPSIIRFCDLATPGIQPYAAGIQLGNYVEGEGKALFDLTKAKGMEGIVAKRKDGLYRPGKRSPDWLKIKSRPQQEFVVGGFTEGKGSRKHLGALLLSAYRNGKLHYFGHSGSGFSEKGLRDALDRMMPLFTDKSPFENPPRIPERIQWVKPTLVPMRVLSITALLSPQYVLVAEVSRLLPLKLTGVPSR